MNIGGVKTASANLACFPNQPTPCQLCLKRPAYQRRLYIYNKSLLAPSLAPTILFTMH